jgi:predicted secreted protein
MRRARLLWLFLGLPGLAAAQVQTPAPGSASVNFHVVTHYRVSRTVLHADLQAEGLGKKPAKLAAMVNQDVAWAKARLQSVPGITWRSAGYQTQMTGQAGAPWLVWEDLAVQSRDPAALLPLLGTLQSRLHLVGMHYAARPAAVHKALRVAELRGLRRYRKEAQQNCAVLGDKGVRLGQVFINTNVVPLARPMPVMAMAARVVPGPTVGRGGTERGRVVVGGNAYCER